MMTSSTAVDFVYSPSPTRWAACEQPAGAPPAADAERNLTDGRAAHPGHGNRLPRLRSKPDQPGAGSPQAGGIKVSSNEVWRLLRRHGLGHGAQHLALVCGFAVPPEPERRPPLTDPHIEADRPGHRVQDCFYVGRLSSTKGVLWQYTAIDVASSYTWVELRVTPENPAAQWTSVLARRVVGELAKKGWKLEAVMTDNAAEFRSKTSTAPSVTSTPSTSTFAPVGRRAMGALSASSRPFSRSAGSLPSLATSFPSTPVCNATWFRRSLSTTPTAATEAVASKE